MPKKEKGKRGAPKGNLNALKHGFYSRVLDDVGKMDMEAAAGVAGIDDEIALLRVKIKSVLEKDPENIGLIMKATNTLAGLVMTRYRINKEHRQGLREAITNVLKEVAIPLGISVGTKVLSK